VVKIGVIVPETGEAGYLGRVVKAGIQKAADDVNQVCSGGFCTQIQLTYRDSQSSPSIALQHFKELYHSNSIQVFAGLVTSAETQAVASYAKDNELEVTLLSASSTASQLCDYSDILVRLSMDDKAQAEVILDVMKNNQKQQILPIVRDDVYGNGLIDDIRMKADSMIGGLEVLQPIRYGPNTITNAEIATRVVQRLSNAHALYPDAMILLVAYSEAWLLLQAASEFPALTEMSWMVSDSLVFSDLNLTNSIILEGVTYTGKTEGTRSLNEYTALFEYLHANSLASMPQAALAYDSISFILLDYNYVTALASMSVHGLTGALDLSSCGDRTIGYYKSVVHFGNSVEHTILSHSQWISLDRYKVIKNEYSGTLPIQVTESSLPAATIQKTEILEMLSSAGENCTDTIIIFTLVDPDTMLEIVETYTLASFPENLTIPAQNGWSSYISCQSSEGSFAVQKECTPADEAGEQVECSTLIQTPTSKRAIPAWVVGCGVAGIGCGIYGVGAHWNWWGRNRIIGTGCGVVGIGCGAFGIGSQLG